MKKLINNKMGMLKLIFWNFVAVLAIVTLPHYAYVNMVEGDYAWAFVNLYTIYLFVTDLKDNTYYKKYISKELY